MAHVIPGRFTAKTGEPFVVFIIGMWLPIQEDLAAFGRGMTQAWYDAMSHNVHTVRFG